jgi:glycerate 2-kinase
VTHYPNCEARDLLQDLFSAAVNASRGDRVIPAISRLENNRWIYAGPGGALSIDLPTGEGRVVVIGAGKASSSMASGLEKVLGDRIDSGIVIVKHDPATPLMRIQSRQGGHPIPDELSAEATHELLRALDRARPEDVVFFLLSGGASSLLCLPVESIAFADKAMANHLLVTSGASIAEINTVRKHMSAVKGGRLRLRCKSTTFCTLAISDVIGDDPSTIGSGPSVADETTFADALLILDRYGLDSAMPASVVAHLRRGASGEEDETPKSLINASYRTICSNRTALDAAVLSAASRGFRVQVLTDRMAGHTHDAARDFALTLKQLAAEQRTGTTPLVVLAGGETTLPVKGHGTGGRNQEFALVAGVHLQDTNGITLLAAGSDGSDGPTDAAGAFADDATVSRARAINRDVQAHLADNDVYPLLEAMGDLYKSGPTGTNVMDLVAAVVGGSGSRESNGAQERTRTSKDRSTGT